MEKFGSRRGRFAANAGAATPTKSVRLIENVMKNRRMYIL
jgi:hypothetical protein